MTFQEAEEQLSQISDLGRRECSASPVSKISNSRSLFMKSIH